MPTDSHHYRMQMDAEIAQLTEANKRRVEAGSSSMQRLVGALGEFTDGRGRTKQCRVTGTMDAGKTLRITYYNDEAGRTIEGAFIAAYMFRPDERPNH